MKVAVILAIAACACFVGFVLTLAWPLVVAEGVFLLAYGARVAVAV